MTCAISWSEKSEALVRFPQSLKGLVFLLASPSDFSCCRNKAVTCFYEGHVCCPIFSLHQSVAIYVCSHTTFPPKKILGSQEWGSQPRTTLSTDFTLELSPYPFPPHLLLCQPSPYLSSEGKSDVLANIVFLPTSNVLRSSDELCWIKILKCKCSGESHWKEIRSIGTANPEQWVWKCGF